MSSSKSKSRLYVDESGDGSPIRASNPESRYLCLLGCIFEDQPYRAYHDRLETLRRSFFPEHHPDHPVILHREDIINQRGQFRSLQDETRRIDFEQAVLDLVNRTKFRLIASIIDKKVFGPKTGGIDTSHSGESARWMREEVAASIVDQSVLASDFLAEKGETADYYGHGYRQLASAYADLLDSGDFNGTIVMEARARRQDGLLRKVHQAILEKGLGGRAGLFFRERLSPLGLDLRPKTNNISGLQLADLLCHPIKCWILHEQRASQRPLGRFAELLIDVLRPSLAGHKMTTHANYGYILCPKQQVSRQNQNEAVE